MKNNTELPAARQTGLIIQETGDELLVYDTETNQANCLNPTAAFVWQNCDGVKSADEIAGLFQKKFGAKVEDDFIWLAIDQLGQKNLLENHINLETAGLSRRDVIKKIGLTAIVALPVVAALTAPTSVLASSSCLCPSGPGAQGNGECAGQPGCGATCQANTQCA